jgi:hypothetical protein
MGFIPLKNSMRHIRDYEILLCFRYFDADF